MKKLILHVSQSVQSNLSPARERKLKPRLLRTVVNQVAALRCPY